MSFQTREWANGPRPDAARSSPVEGEPLAPPFVAVKLSDVSGIEFRS